MKPRPVIKLDKRNTKRQKTFDDDVMLANCDIIFIYRIYGQFEAIQKPDSGHMVGNTYIFINSNILSYKICKQN